MSAGDPAQITTRAEFGAALTRLREAQGLSVRDLARRLDTPAGTIGGYLSGRHLPSAGQLPLFHALLRAVGVEDTDHVEEWTEALSRLRAAGPRRAPRGPSPYQGLAHYNAGDADRFFGRAAETSAMLDRLQRLADDPGPAGGMLAVVGASGSGKSSLLRAGLTAAIDSGQLDTSARRWRCTLITPGSDPVAALRAGLAALPDGGQRVVVIDQFEELFTAVPDAAAQAEFLTRLAALRGTHLVVLGLRADFYAAAAQESLLLPALQHEQVLVGPVSRESLTEIITQPALSAGVTVEDALVDLLLADLAPRDSRGQAHDAGALPLLSYALWSAWNQSSGRQLTVADYRASGGIDGAVSDAAEQLYLSLSEPERDLVRRIFTRLVHLDDVAVTRRRVNRAELDQLTSEEASAELVIDAFVEARLLTTSERTVEVSHEALLTAWPRLHSWVDTDRAGLRQHRQITEAAAAWAEAGADPALLLRGTRLHAAAEWTADPDHRAELTGPERDYVDAAVALDHSEQRQARRRTRRLRRLLAAVAVLALVAAGLAIYSAHARSSAEDASHDASVARDDALSRQVAAQSRDLLAQDPALAQQLALVAYRTAPTDEARGALIDESAEPVVTRILGAQGPTPLAESPDGSLVAVGHADDGTVHLYTVHSGATPKETGVVPGPGGTAVQVFALAFNPSGTVLAVGGEGPSVRLWDVTTPAHPRALAALTTGFAGGVQSIAFSPSGTVLAAGGAGTHPVQLWNIAAAPTLLPPPVGVPTTGTIHAVTFSPDGRRFAAVGTASYAAVWTGSPSGHRATVVLPGTVAATGVDAAVFSPDSTLLYTGTTDGLLRSWHITGTHASVATEFANPKQEVDELALSRDGSRLAVGSADNSLRQWDTATGAELSSVGNPGHVTGVAYADDGHTVLSTATDGALRQTSAQPGLLPVTGSVFTVAYPASGSRLLLAATGDTGGVQLWNTADVDNPVALGPRLTVPGAVADGTGATNRAGTLLAMGSTTGVVQLWNTSDPRHPVKAGATFPGSTQLIEALAFSPSGTVLAVGGDDAKVRLWNVADPAHPALLATLDGGGLVLNLAFSAHGHLLAAASADEHAYVWDVADPAHPVRRAKLGGFQTYAYAVAFNPAGTVLAVGSADHTTLLWNVAHPSAPTRVGKRLIGPTDYIYSVAFSPDGHTLAVASNDHTVRLYDADGTSAVPDTTLDAGDDPVYSVAFSPDGTQVAAAGGAAHASIWTIDTTTDAQRLCRNIGAPITRDEWALYVPGATYNPPCR